MVANPYFGPAGIFSTDNAQADYDQILAEQADDEDDDCEDEGNLPEEEEAEEAEYNEPTSGAGVMIGLCPVCHDWTQWPVTSDPKDHERTKKRILRDLKSWSPDCQGKIEIFLT